MGYFSDVEEVSILGPGTLLFFYFNKRVILLVLLASLLFGLYSVITNYNGSNFAYNCSTSSKGALPFLCEWKVLTSLPNKPPTQLQPQLWLGAGVCLVWIIGISAIGVLGQRKNREIDERLDSSSDYFVCLEGLPQGGYEENAVVWYVERLFRSVGGRERPGVKSVQVVYDLAEVEGILAEMRRLGGAMGDML